MLQQVEPFRSVEEALAALDNGGRFYNIFSRAHDDIVTKGELACAAGTLSVNANAFLYFEMSKQHLSLRERADVISRFEPHLRALYHRFRPQIVTATELELVPLERTVVLAGFARAVSDAADLPDEILVPIVADNVMSYVVVPLVEESDVYRLFERVEGGVAAIVATDRSIPLPTERRIHVGGIVRGFHSAESRAAHGRVYVEVRYFTCGGDY